VAQALCSFHYIFTSATEAFVGITTYQSPRDDGVRRWDLMEFAPSVRDGSGRGCTFVIHRATPYLINDELTAHAMCDASKLISELSIR
jgi:hypothetical protein